MRHLLSEFTYKVIEEGRRRAALTMLETAEKVAGIADPRQADDTFHRESLAYLSLGEEDQDILASIVYDATNVELAIEAISDVNGDDECLILSRRALRLLEDYPQNPGLFYIAFAIEMLSGKPDRAARYFESVAGFGQSNYDLSREECSRWFLEFVNSSSGADVTAEMLNSVIPRVAQTIGAYPDDLLKSVRTDQAERLRRVNRVYRLAVDVAKERSCKSMK